MTETEHKYHIKLDLIADREGNIAFEDSKKPIIHVATPPEFKGGKPNIISPEDLFVSALASCKMTTFNAMAEKLDIGLQSLTIEATGYLGEAKTLDDSARGMAFTKVDIHLIIGIDDEENIKSANKCVELTEKYCLITNSVKTKVNLTSEIKTM